MFPIRTYITTALGLLLVAISQAPAQDASFEVLRQRMLVFDNTGLVASGPDTTTVPITIASGQHFVGNRQIVERNGLFVHVYHTDMTGTTAVYMRRSRNGINWEAPVQVSDPALTGDCYYASVQFTKRQDTSHLLVIYTTHGKAASRDTLYAALSTDAGRTFAPSKQISFHDDSQAIYSTLTAVGDTAYAVWTRATPGGRWDQTWINRSFDRGATWDTMRVAYAGHHFSFYSHAVAGRGGLWIATGDDQFQKMNIQLSRSTTGGGSWTQPSIVNTESGTGQPGNLCYYPSLERGLSNTIYCVWSDPREGQHNIYFSRSDNNGTNWIPHVRVNDLATFSPAANDAGSAGARRASILLSQLGNLYVIWSDDREGPSTEEGNRNRDVYISRSTDDGETWSTSIRVNAAPQFKAQNSPAIAVRSRGTRDSVLVMWNDARGTLSGVKESLTAAGGLQLSLLPNMIDHRGLLRLGVEARLAGRPLRISLLDPLGRTVRELYSSIAIAGDMELAFTSDGLSSGLYFCRAECDGQTVLQRVVIR